MTAFTLGIGNIGVSLAEDLHALTLVATSLFLPAVGLVLLIALLAMVAVAGTWAIQHGARLSLWLRGK